MTTATRKTYGATALVALALLFIGVTILITFVLRGARLDLTESKLYSLAPGTERIVSSLAEPVNLYFFFSQDESKQSPQLRAYAQRVRELLEEMSQHSKGKLRLSVVDPKPFSEDEDRATEFGLTPVPLTQGGEPVYFGLAGTNSTDGRETIGLFQPDKEEFLEYDVASLVYRLSKAKRAVVGLISGLPVDAQFDQMSGQMNPGWASIAQLREVLDVRTLQADGNEIPAEVGVLMVVHPKDFNPQVQYAIDQFVLRGGKLISFIDPQSENDNAGAQMGMPPMGGRSSTLGPLLDAWGVQFDPNQIVGDRELGLTVSLRQGQPPSQHIAIIGFNRASMNPKDVTVSTLDTINVMTAGALSKKEGATIEFEPLIQTSTNAGLLPAAKLMFMQNSDALLDDFKATGERYTIAARIHGKLKSAFPNGKPGAEGAAGAHLTESKEDANIIIVADTDILADPLWVRTQNVFGQRFAVAWANNGDFLGNSVDNLAGSSDLISVRGRQSFFRPFTKVDQLRRQAGDQLRSQEKELDKELKETEQKLAALEGGRSGAQSSLSLSPEQEAELERFQHERVKIRKELRETRRSLDQEIEDLGWWLKLLNVAAVPFLLALGAIFLEITRRRRLRAGRAAAHTG
ncbi:Gldg family protein [Steroidobacter sp.]|uniref:Gldg family protein n=1 Tax=Steroidobacter sp. TaxID=1978227 RepID=UPI001A3F48FC|nr:Gldg family protein [Steroidobacter sp.]MBL8269786.1 Gldg family protein [Steroidobacter sp.]